MKLGLYYHIPVYKLGERIFVSSLFGVFIESLVNNCEFIYLFLHEASDQQKKECDYFLNLNKIEWINLGLKNPAWSRDLFHYFLLGKYKSVFSSIDALVVRSPTPYGPYFQNYIAKKKLVYMIVGDYGDGAKNYKIRNFRDIVVQKYIARNDRKFSKILVGANIIVNSDELYNKYSKISNHIKLVRTTTLSDGDFFQRTNTCHTGIINLLYTGRIDMAKGLKELMYGLSMLKRDINQKIVLHIVGWDTDKSQSNLNELKIIINELKLQDDVLFHGKKALGEELNTFYRMADIYVFPSYFEGFPRTIWEAMANSLPIVSTPVGGIPFVLKENINTVFAEPKNSKSLMLAIKKMISNSALREQLILNCFKLAKNNTLDSQSKLLVEEIRKFIN
jgi:glycosyltransferase involved in cell wall biosynthesis